MNRATHALLFLFGFLFISTHAFGQAFNERLLSATESAYNPIPSPDGKMIAYVRTGRWEKGSGGFGQSNLRSEVKVMDTQGQILTDKPLAETYLAGWTSGGKNLICYRNREYFLVSLNGEKSKAIRYISDIIVDRGVYLESLDAWIFVEHLYMPARGLLRSPDEVIARNEASHLGKMLVPSPNGRYIAAIDVTRWAEDQLWVYDLQNKSWANLGKATTTQTSSILITTGIGCTQRGILGLGIALISLSFLDHQSWSVRRRAKVGKPLYSRLAQLGLPHHHPTENRLHTSRLMQS